MKRNRKLHRYGLRLISAIEKQDNDSISYIRNSFDNISIFIKGIKQEIRDNHGSKSDDTFDYQSFNIRARGYLAKIGTFVYHEYRGLANMIDKNSKSIYMMYRDEFVNQLKNLDFTPKVISEQRINVSFGGTPAQSFTRHLRGQLQRGFEPASLIKTVSQDHVALIQREMLGAVARGKGFGWATDRVIREMYPKGVDDEIKKRMEYNVNRIARTSYMSAVNADTSDFVAGNTDIFYGMRRVANGRPCIACVAQDGKFLEPGEILVDHPNGMCTLVPMPYPDEYFMTGKITKPINDTFDKPLAEKFYDMSEKEQKIIFGNNQLYELWKREKFDLDAIISPGDFRTPMSYRQALLSLNKIGGISYPQAEFFALGDESSLLSVLDPKDRMDDKLVVTRNSPIGGNNKWDINLIGDGSGFIANEKIPPGIRAKVSALWGEEPDLKWYSFNQRARDLGIYIRKDIDGRIYYAVPKKDVAKQLVSLSTTQSMMSSDEFIAYINRTGISSSSNEINQGVNKTEIITLKDNRKIVHKKVVRSGIEDNELGMEGFYYKFGSDIGMTHIPVTSVSPARDEMWMDFVRGDTYNDLYYKLNIKQRAELEKRFKEYVITTKEGNDFVLMDWLMSAVDRHNGNYIIDTSLVSNEIKINKIWAIDNGRSMSKFSINWRHSSFKSIMSKYKDETGALFFEMNKETVKGLKAWFSKMGVTDEMFLDKELLLKNWDKISSNIIRYMTDTGFFTRGSSYSFGNKNTIPSFIGRLKTIIESDWRLDLNKLTAYSAGY